MPHIRTTPITLMPYVSYQDDPHNSHATSYPDDPHNSDAVGTSSSNMIFYLSIPRQVTESEGVADNCRSRCEKQNIPFYRFSPELDDVISLSETDNEKLCGIILKTKGLLQSVDTQVDELVQMFYHLFDCSRKFEEDGKPKF